ncbi:hypothetical protein [Allorhizocola rhizosphaerae]|uniref:hypothetical protein n=1 Tax=Allorhizocola rhizosphaerae TaxID=1872709 RepID=UPI0013C30ED3|nr:hypothetical protein [Allorhizocola rhizosphaerae]
MSSVVVGPSPSAPAGPPDPAGRDDASLRGRLRPIIRSGWIPAVGVCLVTIVALHYYAVPFGTTLTFIAYIALGVSLPGTLVWRALQRRSGAFVFDVAAGTALGYALETLLYIPSRWIGAPWLVWVWPVAIVAAFAAVPGLRRFWRGSSRPEDRTPPWFAWSVAGIFMVIVYWSCTRFFRTHGLVWPYFAAPDADSPFHLAIIGEAKHHMPLTSPWLPEEPLLYHWFVYSEMAATSWATGIEPQVLLLRLSLLPFLATFLVLVAAIARKLTGLWWTGPVAGVMTFFVLAPNPYPWPLHGWFSTFATSPVDDGSNFRVVMWTSPTQTFGVALFALVVLVLTDLLRGASTRGRWALLSLMLVAVMGAKATFLPILCAALMLVIAVGLLMRRGLNKAAVAAFSITLVCLLYAQFVLFGGASQGLQLKPLNMTRISGNAYTTGFATGDDVPLWRLLLIALITVACWAAIWFGIAGLFRRRSLLEPATVMLIGIGLAGMAAIMLLGHEGGAEGWFLNSARPYLGLAAVVGLASFTYVKKLTWQTAAMLGSAVLFGLIVMRAVRYVVPNEVPTVLFGTADPGAIRDYKWLAWQLVYPYLLVAAAAGLFIAGVFIARKRSAAVRAISFPLIVAVLAGFGLFSTADHLLDAARTARSTYWRNVLMIPPTMAEGSRDAGRWLRDHSDSDDLVATNAHCLHYPGTKPELCDNRHFHIAAFTERRVLIEGWGFTARTHVESRRRHEDLAYVTYWDQAKLAANDAAFLSPSAQTIGRLRDEFGVRWLFVDETAPFSTDIERHATLRFRSGKSAVYEITG